jgi:hypothetical protein
MKVAVLCNGPSRTVYKGRGDYDYVMGCNIPWEKDVDATTVIDNNVVDRWWKDKELITVPTYFSTHAWRECITKRRAFFKQYWKGIISVLPEYDSSGHNAVKVVLSLGATQIDIYGCDSMFKQTTVSYTNNFIPKEEYKNVQKQIDGWKNNWNNIISKHPDVRFNFIGENDEIISY